MVYKFRGAIGFTVLIMEILSSASFGVNVLALVQKNYFIRSENLKGLILFGSSIGFFIATSYLMFKVYNMLIAHYGNKVDDQ